MLQDRHARTQLVSGLPGAKEGARLGPQAGEEELIHRLGRLGGQGVDAAACRPVPYTMVRSEKRETLPRAWPSSCPSFWTLWQI